MIRPSAGWISQDFHSAHMAVDIVDAYRSPILAPEDGTITYTGQMGSGTNDAGLVVQIGDTSSRAHRLCHLDEILVSNGQRVSKGQIVGRMGFTGYTQPDNVVAGTHLHWVMWDNGRRVRGLDYVTNDGGNTMNDDSARQIGFHYLGRHGRDGRPNALLAPQGDLQGRPLTNESLGEIFLSQESRQWRDADMPNLFNERDRLRSDNASLQGQLTTANQQVASLTSQVSTLTQERDKAVKDYNDIKAVNADLVKKNEEQAKRIAELEAQTGNVTINFNFFGIILWTILKVVGIKK